MSRVADFPPGRFRPLNGGIDIARCIMPDILAFYESEEGQREFAEWKERREAEKQEEKAE